MKFLFTSIPTYQMNGLPPQGVSMVATVAKKAGLDVSMLLSESENDAEYEYEQLLERHLEKEKIDVVCFGAMSPLYSYIKRLIKVCSNAGCLTILGGNIVDPTPELIAANIGADFCIVGEAEETFVELAFALQDGKKDFSNINGLAYRAPGGEIIKTAPRAVIRDLDTLPYIDDELVGFERYIKNRPELYIMGSRSCPYKCTFCYHLSNSYYRSRGLDHIFGEIEFLLNKYKKYNIKRLSMSDEMLSVDKVRILEFCKRIKKLGLDFAVQTRLDAVDDEILKALKDAGCYRVAYGVESANNRILRSMKKQVTIETIDEKVDLTVKNGLQVYASVILGDIEDDIESVNDSVNWAVRKAQTSHISIAMIRVFPGTHLYKYALEKGIIKDELEFVEKGCPIVNVSKLTDEEHTLLIDKCASFHDAKTKLYASPLTMPQMEFAIHKNGLVDFTAYCPNCFAKLEYKNIKRDARGFDFTNLVGCPNCTSIIDLFLTRFIAIGHDSFLIEKLAEEYFAKYKGSRIAVWGINSHNVRKMFFESQTFRDCVVKIVDLYYSDYAKQTYCGLTVDPIETLKDVEFDYIIISTIKSRGAVIKQMKEMGIDVPIIF